jgi:hypothetical protein
MRNQQFGTEICREFFVSPASGGVGSSTIDGTRSNMLDTPPAKKKARLVTHISGEEPPASMNAASTIPESPGLGTFRPAPGRWAFHPVGAVAAFAAQGITIGDPMPEPTAAQPRRASITPSPTPAPAVAPLASQSENPITPGLFAPMPPLPPLQPLGSQSENLTYAEIMATATTSLTADTPMEYL